MTRTGLRVYPQAAPGSRRDRPGWEKQYLVESRLTPLVRQLSLSSISELVAKLRTEPWNGLHVRVVEAMVTTETSFFRDTHPFEALRKAVLPELMNKRSGRAQAQHLVCAPVPRARNPIAWPLLIREHFPELAGWNVSLLASDISREMLERARQGKYNQIEVNRGLPASLLVKHFVQHGTTWQLSENIRKMVRFEEINLARPWPVMPKMDLVMIRNVMIYFDVPTKKDILGRMARVLKPDGYLLLGGVETTLNLDDSYRRVELHKTGFYQLDSCRSTSAQDQRGHLRGKEPGLGDLGDLDHLRIALLGGPAPEGGEVGRDLEGVEDLAFLRLELGDLGGKIGRAVSNGPGSINGIRPWPAPARDFRGSRCRRRRWDRARRPSCRSRSGSIAKHRP